MLLGRIYGPADLYFAADPWRPLASARHIGPPRNPILSDLAFANLPWRAAVQEAVANGRVPIWNRFVLAGTPLLAAGQAGVLHPSTILSLPLPLATSWTFSCTFTLFLALVCGFLLCRDLALDVVPSLLGAAAWGFSTYLVFWIGWSVGPSTASFPLLLLGLRRLARETGRGPVFLTAAALALSIFGGHPESAFHGAAAGGAFFFWELFGVRQGRLRALGGALAAGTLALLLSGPQLFPLLEAIPHSAEYRARRDTLARGAGRQSVAVSEAASRLLPDLLPFAHGIFGKSPVRIERKDGSGMPIGYAGAVLFPLAGMAFRGPRRLRREIAAFAAMFVAGILHGASFPGLIDATSRLPGFRIALNYRLVFLAALGLAGLAAIGAQRLLEKGSARSLAWAASGWTLAVAGAFVLSRGVFRDRGLPEAFVLRSVMLEAVPLLLLAALARLRGLEGAPLAACALALLVAQRGAEMGGTYPTLPAAALAPSLPTLAAIPPASSDPCRVVALGDTLRPNGSTLYRLEDARGYESLVLARFADTYPMWSLAQAASFNRVADLSRPFLSFLNVCYAIGAPDGPVPPGWREQARGSEMAIFSNPAALPRAFVPRRVRHVADPATRLAELARETDFARTAWVSADGPADEANGEATLFVRAVGPDLVLAARVSSPALIATSIPDWPGWAAREGELSRPTVTVNHAFVGIRLPAGEHVVRLEYRPPSWRLGLAAFAVGAAAMAVAAGRARGHR